MKTRLTRSRFLVATIITVIALLTGALFLGDARAQGQACHPGQKCGCTAIGPEGYCHVDWPGEPCTSSIECTP